MRQTSLASLIAAASLFASVADAGVDLPKRKPGYWQLVTVSSETGMATSEACIGPNDNIAISSEMGSCTEPKVTPAGSEIIVDVVCTNDGGQQKMSTVFNGDFSTRYRAIMKISFDPPPQRGAPTLGVTIDGKYMGPDCPAAAPPAK